MSREEFKDQLLGSLGVRYTHDNDFRLKNDRFYSLKNGDLVR